MTRQYQWTFLDNLRRKTLIKSEVRRALLRSVLKSKTAPLSQRYKASFGLSHIPKRASIVKPRNRCIISGRTWNVIRKAQYSRFNFRTKSYSSFMPGIRRACW